MGKQYTSYQSALAYLGLDRLDARRIALSSKFAKKALKSQKYPSWFVKDANVPNTRRERKYVKGAKYRTKRLHKSAFPYLTHIFYIVPQK